MGSGLGIVVLGIVIVRLYFLSGGELSPVGSCPTTKSKCHPNKSARYTEWNMNYTERQKKLITSSERRSLESTTLKLIISGHR